MSNRAMKKLHHGMDQVLAAQLSTHGDEMQITDSVLNEGGGEEEHGMNPFDVLMVDSDECDENSARHHKTEHSPTVLAVDDTNDGHKRKRRKKKKCTAEDTALNPQQQVEDEIDAGINAVNHMLQTTSISLFNCKTGSQGDGVGVRARNVLSVEYRYLNVDEEIRQRIGRASLRDSYSGRAKHRSHAAKRHLVKHKGHWPHMEKIGLSMSAQRLDDDSRQLFSFEHNAEYRRVQLDFLSAVKSLDPSGLANILHQHPFHIDSMLQLSGMFHANEDFQTSMDLLERVLSVMEYAFHPCFNITSGNCRLDFRRQESRPMFLALYKYLLAVGRKGCYRTALEYCKLLLSLDTDDDPMFVLLIIDYFAIRSEQYHFLIRFYEEWEPHRNLSQLVNFAFSVPLAMFHLGKSDEDFTRRADGMLQDTLLMFPMLLMPLLEKCGVLPDPSVSSHPFFSHHSGQCCQSEALSQLVALYVGRCAMLWKDCDVIVWLESVVKATLALVDAGDSRLEKYKEKRAVRYQQAPRNLSRHVLISDVTETRQYQSPEALHAPLLSYDPLPPDDAIVSYSRPTVQRPPLGRGEENLLSLFLQSLLPGYTNHQEEEDDSAAGAVDRPAGAVGGGSAQDEESRVGNVRSSIGSVMTAMRDLLSNIGLTPAEEETRSDGEYEASEGEEYFSQQDWD